jgi:hypothetical protein
MVKFLTIIKAQPNEDNIAYVNINLSAMESVNVYKTNGENYTKISLFTINKDSYYPFDVKESPEHVIDRLNQESPFLHEYSKRTTSTNAR